MASYNEWNQALLTYFAGMPRGSRIFLAVDDEVIHDLGRFLNLQGQEPLEDFKRAIRQKVLFGERINLEKIYGRNRQNEPQGLAFLAAMVLAASKMGDEEEISQNNYFKRLREVLTLPLEPGRPNGMESGDEEPLWLEWARWLQENDFLRSAQRGEGSNKYVNYPISQTLLRKADRERLRRLFNDKGWPQDWDVETLAAQVQKEAFTLPQHLQTLLSQRGERDQAVTEAIYDVYERWQDDPDALGFSSSYSRRANLIAGLLRAEDVQGETIYYLYPKQLRRRRTSQEVLVRIGDTAHSLVQDRPGWYNPVHEVTAEELNKGAHYPIEQPSELKHLILPQRQFWILTPDPENPDFGDYATYGPPQLGTPFLLLCQQELQPNLKRLHHERLIQWEGQPEELFTGWLEFYNCQVIAQNWSGIFIENEALHTALQPRRSLNISLSGGMYTAQGSGYIFGYGPQITVFGFYPEADVHIFRISSQQEQEVSHPTQSSKPSNQPFSFEWPGTGTYRVEASYAGEKAERLLKIVAWEELSISPVRDQESIQLKGLHLCGALIERVKEVKGGWQYMLPL